MAELLVRVIDKVNSDPEKDAQCTKRGDVIAVCPDGWNWSTIERTNPEWRIIKTSLSVEEANKYLEKQDDSKSEFDVTKSKKLAKRKIKIDIDDPTIPTGIKDSIEDVSRTTPIIDMNTVDITKLEVIKAIK